MVKIEDLCKVENNNKEKPTELNVKYVWSGKVILDRKQKKGLKKYLKWARKELKEGLKEK